MTNDGSRYCPECGSTDIVLIQRGLTGPTDESDQYFECHSCGRKTFEILSRSERDVRLEKLAAGKQIRAEGHDYRVTRILKVGLNEYLIYVRPESSAAS